MKKNRLFWLVAIVGFLLDQGTKLWVVESFSEIGETIALWEDVFHFTYVINRGAAFSLFADNGRWLRWLSLAVTLGLMIFAWLSPRLPKLEQLGYGFVLAGAAGNGLDRFLFGYVVDFLDFRLIQFPIFNLADICINIGIIFLIITNLPYFQRSHRPRNGKQNRNE
jgi:signal peptidase II